MVRCLPARVAGSVSQSWLLSTGAHDTLLQGACAAPFCKKRPRTGTLSYTPSTHGRWAIKLMRVIFPTRGGINRLSRLARLPVSAPQDRLIGGSSLFPRFARALTDRCHGVPQRRMKKARRFLYALSRLYCNSFLILFTSDINCHLLPQSAKSSFKFIFIIVEKSTTFNLITCEWSIFHFIRIVCICHNIPRIIIDTWFHFAHP